MQIVVQPIRNLAPVNALYRHGNCMRPRRGGRDRIAAPDDFAVDRDFESDELTRMIAEQPWRVGDKAEGFDVMSLVDHLNTADRHLSGPAEHVGTEVTRQQRGEIRGRRLFLDCWFRLGLDGSSSGRPLYQFEECVECGLRLPVPMQ